MNYISLLSPWSVQLRQCSAAARRREEVQCGPGCVDVLSAYQQKIIQTHTSAINVQTCVMDAKGSVYKYN